MQQNNSLEELIRLVDKNFEINISLTMKNNEVIVSGDVVSISDYWLIKEKVINLVEKGNKEIIIIFNDAEVLSSSIIGFFLKLVLKDKINLKVKVRNSQLYSFMETLGLIKTLQVEKI
ncbi:MAG: hypothetical protein OD816_001207 [Thermodesulfobacterium sp.]|uniref:STAS domain-containing protein n=1 Tax=Candidatus Thermodesulfobacterium syntrophicum TaxID=3060442 RepID=A0AAE3P109_9BACT|nr:hypothetical protein [Candidatus Thermodesulfobacterium syntrophicum]